MLATDIDMWHKLSIIENRKCRLYYKNMHDLLDLLLNIVALIREHWKLIFSG